MGYHFQILFLILLILICFDCGHSKSQENQLKWQGQDKGSENILSHSCIHDQILEQSKRRGQKIYSITPQVYGGSTASNSLQFRERTLLGIPTTSGQLNEANKPIRIHINYDAVGHSPDRECQKLGEPPAASNLGTPCTSEDIAGEDKRHRLRKAFGQTADWFKRALAVEHVRGNLRLSGDSYSACGRDGGMQLPREYVEEGVSDADLVLLVTTRPTTGDTLAWAVACERDQWGRAIAGRVNVSPQHLTAEAEPLLSVVLIHEVMHVLGFDANAFGHFRDERKRRRGQVTEQAMDEKLGKMVTRVVLPRVVMHSRLHYGAFSENFTGLELEDGGGPSTSGSHWEKRLLMNEIMTGTADTRSVVSKMTLALLEDSGWYQANYSMAGHLDWGHNQGTDFVTAPCNLWKGAYHCNTTQLTGCTYNREAKGYCPIKNYSEELPQWARYFPQATKGGWSVLADYCTYFVAYSNGYCRDTNSTWEADRMVGETLGSGSRCMASSLVRKGFNRDSMTQGDACYQHRCIHKTFEVAVDGHWKMCPEAGGPIQFPGFNGELVCPAYHELCSRKHPPVFGQCPNSCNSKGDCVDGRCHCYLGFNGHDCSKSVCDQQCSLHVGVEFHCSDYAGFSCRNSSTLLESLSMCKDVLMNDAYGQHCAPSDSSILQQLEKYVVMPYYSLVYPRGARKILYILRGRNCDKAAKRLACLISIQKCDKDGDNRLRVCHSTCQSYNLACGSSLGCTDQTLFSEEDDDEGENLCTGWGEKIESWF